MDVESEFNLPKRKWLSQLSRESGWCLGERIYCNNTWQQRIRVEGFR